MGQARRTDLIIMGIPDTDARQVAFEDGWSVTQRQDDNGFWTVTTAVQYKPNGTTRYIYNTSSSPRKALLATSKQLMTIADVVLHTSDGESKDHFRRIVNFARVVRELSFGQ